MVHDVGGCPFARSLPFGEAWIEILTRRQRGVSPAVSLPFGEARIRISYDSHESF